MADACMLTDWARDNSILPVAGGLLDQADSFVEFGRVLSRYEAEVVESRKAK